MQLSDREIEEIIGNLDSECWNCESTSPIAPDKDGKCGICHGVGYILRPAGKYLLNFIARHECELEMQREIARRMTA